MRLKKLGFLIVPCLFVGCASIPPEAPELSTELGKRISAIEESNIKLLNKFFDQKREEVDKFIENEWIPEFAENIFSNEKISRDWDVIVNENNKKDRLTFIIKLGPKLQKKINDKRLELIKPLDLLERTIEKEIRMEYTQAKAINNSISSLLLSASNVTENRNRYLEMVGITDGKIGKVIDKTDDIVSELLDKGKDASDKADKAKAFISNVKSLRDSI